MSEIEVKNLSVVYKSKKRETVALEPQFAPNAINMDGFSKPILEANKQQRHYIRLVF